MLKVIILILGYVTLLVSLLPLLRLEAWYIRVWDYPRSQKFWINLFLLVVFIVIVDYGEIHDRIFVMLLCTNQLYLLSQIWSYTPLAKIQMKSSATTAGNQIGLFIANVFQDNRDYERCRKLIRQYNPDLILLVETDHEWWRAMEEFRNDYPHVICQPQSNTYGICLLSKFAIRKHEVRFLVEKDVPSLVADLEDQQGREFRLYGLHPKPPVPHESKESTERDAEILIVGREAKKSAKPVIVAGDLNDVAWSYTTNLFLKVSNLLDPRIGRGFFSTFHASHRLLRWPLDHVFLSSHFTLTTIKRLPHIGSDHFPIYIRVVLLNQEDGDNRANEKKANPAQEEVAREKIQDAAKVE